MKNKKMEFYSLLDFFIKKEKIRNEYKKLTNDEKEIYKLYVYSICFETENNKDLIWEYLNGWEESQQELYEQYNEKINKMERRK